MGNLTISALITIEKSGKQIDTLKDWGLAVGNNNYIGDPVQEVCYQDVPGASGLLDLSEVLCDRPIFKSRPIIVKFGGKRNRMDWDAVISYFRNEIEGKVIKLTFSNDVGYYWRGRASIVGFDRSQGIGQFQLKIEKAEPYKYEVLSSNDEWEWDTFDFEAGAIRYIGEVEFDNNTIVIPRGSMLTVPVFWISSIHTERLKVVYGDVEYNLGIGKNRFPQILIAGEEEVELRFVGKGKGTIQYRGGSL